MYATKHVIPNGSRYNISLGLLGDGQILLLSFSSVPPFYFQLIFCGSYGGLFFGLEQNPGLLFDFSEILLSLGVIFRWP